MKLSNKDKNTLLLLSGALILALCYFFVFKPMTAKCDELVIENMRLTAEANTLQAYADSAELYQNETLELQQNIGIILARYPVCVYPENEIMKAVELEHIDDGYISSILCDDPVLTELSKDYGAPEYSDARKTASENDEEVIYAPYPLYYVSTSIDFELSYKELRNVINSLLVTKDKRGLTGLYVSLDEETGLLMGTLNYDSYYLENQTDKNYIAPYPGYVPSGQEDIFGETEGNND